MKPIRIFTPNIDLLAEISNYESLMFIRSWHGIGDLELRINRHKLYTDKLKKGNVIVIGDDTHKAYLILHREIELDEAGKATENWLIRGLELKSVVGNRITLPPVHTSHDNKAAVAETVMKHYVNGNVVNPVDGKRKIPQLLLSPDLNRGSHINWQSRFKNVAEEQADISLVSGIGWNVGVDYDLQKWMFDVYEGRDLTVNQDVNSPVIFSPQFDNIKNMHYVDSDLNFKNAAYIAGQGEGIDRRVIELGQASGLARKELFVDARDVSEEIEQEGADPIPRPVHEVIADLINRGEQKLAEMIQEIFLEAQVLMGTKSEKVPKSLKGSTVDVRLDAVDLWGVGRNLASNLISKWMPGLSLTQDGFFFKSSNTGYDGYFEIEAIVEEEFSFSGIGYSTGDGGTANLNFAFMSSANQHLTSRTFALRDIKTPTKLTGSNVAPVGTAKIRIYSVATTGKGIFFKNIKVERGKTSTPWQPAPEDNIPWYHPTKTINLPPIDLSKLGRYQSSKFNWITDTPIGTKATVDYSFDDVNWHPLQSGDSLPLNEGDWLTGKTLYLRQTLSTTDQTLTPSISGFKYEINGYTLKKTISTVTFQYEEDWDLGDIVTIQNTDWNVTLDARITEVKEIYEPETGMQIEATFGNSRPTLISKIKQELSGMRNEIVR